MPQGVEGRETNLFRAERVVSGAEGKLTSGLLAAGRGAPGENPANSRKSAQMQIALEQLEALLSTLEEKKVAEFEYEDEKIRLRVGFGRAQVTTVAAPVAPIAFAAPAAAGSAGAASETLEAGVVYVTSPFVGTFYRAPSPDAGNFVEVGSQVKQGQALCIIEAMKLMNEIESEFVGSVLEILVENGKSVEFGQKLFKIKKA